MNKLIARPLLCQGVICPADQPRHLIAFLNYLILVQLTWKTMAENWRLLDNLGSCLTVVAKCF